MNFWLLFLFWSLDFYFCHTEIFFLKYYCDYCLSRENIFTFLCIFNALHFFPALESMRSIVLVSDKFGLSFCLYGCWANLTKIAFEFEEDCLSFLQRWQQIWSYISYQWPSHKETYSYLQQLWIHPASCGSFGYIQPAVATSYIPIKGNTVSIALRQKLSLK